MLNLRKIGLMILIVVVLLAATEYIKSKFSENRGVAMADTAGGVTTGMIIPFSGSIANIPADWYLCDGNNGTPDLRDRFVIASGGAYSKGSTGGALTHTHGEWDVSVTDAHFEAGNKLIDSTPSGYYKKGSAESGPGAYLIDYETTISAGNNMPPYYALAFIMTTITGAVLPGGIVMWTGSKDCIPAGYVLCDGNSGTPNLQDKFIIGAGGSHNVNATGGFAYHSHTFTLSADLQLDQENSITRSYPSGNYADTYHFDMSTGTGYGGNPIPYYSLAFIMATGTRGTYTGMIVIWSGAVADIPTGWLNCDGTNGTPNLARHFTVQGNVIYSGSTPGGPVAHSHGNPVFSRGAVYPPAGNKMTNSGPNGTLNQSLDITLEMMMTQSGAEPPYMALPHIMKQ